MPAPKACLYARYSSDQQRQTSIDDQLRAARALAEREGWVVMATHTDEGISGAVPPAQRPGAKALIADMLARRFDILICEGLDRLARDLGEQEQLVKRLEHRSIRIIGTADGYDTETRGRKVMRVIRGLQNEMYLDDLREKTHRGLAGQFDRGLSAGGRSYGYTSVDVDGRGKRLAVDELEAVHVRWVFDRYAEGWSVPSIVHDLNRRGVKSPRGGTWAVSAVHGSAARGLGLLHNEIYSGRVVWNRRQWLKDPETGKRKYIERPRDEWQIREQPELRIVDEQTWQRVRRRIEGVQQRGQALAKAKKGGRPARTLFGGLLTCPACSGPIVAVNTTRYGCSVHKDRGAAVCTNAHTVDRAMLDKRLLAVVREELLQPDMLAELQAEVRALMSEARRDATAAVDGNRRRLHALDAEIGRLVEAVATMGLSGAIATRLRAAEAEKAALQAQIAAVDAPTIDPIVDVIAQYKAMMIDLQRRLEAGDDRQRTRELLAQMMGKVTVVKGEDGATYAEMQNPAEQLLAAGGVESLTVVAGARNANYRLVRISG